MTRIMLTFNPSLETEYLGHVHYLINYRQILLEGMQESWQKKVAFSCP